MKFIYRLLLHVSLLLLLTLSVVRLAYAVQVHFSGTLQSNPPCVITGDNDPITVNFGDVGITQIDGTRYAKSFTLNVLCDVSMGNNITLYFGYDGMNASFDDDALQTSRNGLGIKLYRSNGDIIQPDNSNHSVVMSGGVSENIKLTAIPVKDPDPALVLYEGPFTATGTVEIRYP